MKKQDAPGLEISRQRGFCRESTMREKVSTVHSALAEHTIDAAETGVFAGATA
jgi:hypothetical protein